MSKIKFLTVCVALVFMFSACNKDASEPLIEGEDDVDVTVKGFQKLDPNDDDNFNWVYKWNSITASEFGKLPTPPFNNFAEVAGTGITVFRTKDDPKTFTKPFDINKVKLGNGNDPVYLYFSPKAKGNDGTYKNILQRGTFYLGAKYKASNNVAFEFNVFLSIVWCQAFGPIPLQCESFTDKDLGAVTQVRIGKFVPKPGHGDEEKCKDGKCYEDCKDGSCDQKVDPKYVKVTIEGVGDPLEFPGPDDGTGECPVLTLDEIATDELIAKLNLAENRRVIDWVYEDGTSFIDGEVCEDITLKPIIETFVKVCVYNNNVLVNCEELPICTPLLAYLNEAYSDLIVSTPTQKFVGWHDVADLAKDYVDAEYNACQDEMLEPIFILPPTVTILDPDGEPLPDFPLTWDKDGACPVLTFDVLKENDYIKEVNKKLFIGWFDASDPKEEIILSGDILEREVCDDIKLKPKYADFIGYGDGAVLSTSCNGQVVTVGLSFKELYEGGLIGEKHEVFFYYGGTANKDPKSDLPFIQFPNSSGCGGNYWFGIVKDGQTVSNGANAEKEGSKVNPLIVPVGNGDNINVKFWVISSNNSITSNLEISWAK